MTDPGTYTWNEINTQPEAWKAALEQIRAERQEIERLLEGGFDEVIFTGCGSTYYAALAAAAVFTTLTGRRSRGLPGSELWLNPGSHYPSGGRYLLVPISRSGETSETIQACQYFREAGLGQILSLSCYPGTRLAGLGDLNLVLPSGQEESYAQTRAFTTLYLAAMALSCFAAGRDDLFAQMDGLPGACERLLKRHTDAALQLGGDLTTDRVYFLGSGLHYGLACELSMKMKEMSLTHCEPFHFLEFRHGPKTMASQGALIVGLISATNAAKERAVAADMQEQGARAYLIGEGETGAALESGLPEVLRGPLYLPAGQLLSYARAIARGLNPDRPANLEPVIKL